MELFTIISLMIGVFGGTLSVIVVIKNFGDRAINQKIETAETQLNMVADSLPGKDSPTACDRYLKCLRFCKHFWQVVILIPILVFAFWSFFSSFHISISEECKYPFSTFVQDDQNQTPTFVNGIIIPEGNEVEPYYIFRGDVDFNDVRRQSNIVSSSWLFQRPTILIVTIIDCLCIIMSLCVLSGVQIIYYIFKDQITTVIDITGRLGQLPPSDNPPVTEKSA